MRCVLQEGGDGVGGAVDGAGRAEAKADFGEAAAEFGGDDGIEEAAEFSGGAWGGEIVLDELEDDLACGD
jgi:hypothetical protein